MANSPVLLAEARFLIVLMGSLGDVSRGLALVSPLKRQFPRASLTWLVEPACRELVEMHPEVDDILIFERSRGIRGVRKILAALRSQRFDVVLDLQRILKSGLFSYFSGAQRRIGFHPRNTKELNHFFHNESIDAVDVEHAKLLHYFLFLQKLGVKDAVPEAEIEALVVPPLPQWYQNAVQAAPTLVVVLGSAWASKDWTPEGYRGLCGMMLEQLPHTIVLAGTKQDAALGELLERSLKSDRLIAAAGKTTVKELTSILAAADAAVGPDSGPGHLASALGTPYVALFGPTSPARTAPAGAEHLVVTSAVGCAPCYRKHCPGLNRVCMRLISVPAVMEKLLAINKLRAAAQ